MSSIGLDPYVLRYDDEFPFGKHFGKVISDIIVEDIDYIIWLIEKSEWEFDEEVMQEVDSGGFSSK